MLILVSAMPYTAAAVHDKKLVSLDPVLQGKVIVTTGRLGEECLIAHLGVQALSILMPQSRIAQLYMWRAHCGESNTEHKSIAENLALIYGSIKPEI